MSISVENRGRSTDLAARWCGPNSKHQSKPPDRAPTIAACQKIQDLGQSVARHTLHVRRSSAPQRSGPKTVVKSTSEFWCLHEAAARVQERKGSDHAQVMRRWVLAETDVEAVDAAVDVLLAGADDEE